MKRVIFLWGRQRSGTNWTMRLIMKNFNDIVIVIAWKHCIPRSMPGHLHRPLMEGRPPDADELEALAGQLYAPSGSPAQVFISDDIALPEPTALSVHPDIEKTAIDAIARNAQGHVCVVKHPENWLASINGEWPGQGWCLEHWNASAEWMLSLRDRYGATIVRWEDLYRDLNNLNILEPLLGKRRQTWRTETRIVGNHGTEPPPDRALFQPRKPAIASPEERAFVSPGLMEALGYKWDNPLIQA